MKLTRLIYGIQGFIGWTGGRIGLNAQHRTNKFYRPLMQITPGKPEALARDSAKLRPDFLITLLGEVGCSGIRSRESWDGRALFYLVGVPIPR